MGSRRAARVESGQQKAEPRLKRVRPTAASLVNSSASERAPSLLPSFPLSPSLSLFVTLPPTPFTKRIPLISKHVISFSFFRFCSSLPKGFYLHPPIALTRSSCAQVPALQLRRNGGLTKSEGNGTSKHVLTFFFLGGGVDRSQRGARLQLRPLSCRMRFVSC